MNNVIEFPYTDPVAAAWFREFGPEKLDWLMEMWDAADNGWYAEWEDNMSDAELDTILELNDRAIEIMNDIMGYGQTRH